MTDFRGWLVAFVQIFSTVYLDRYATSKFLVALGFNPDGELSIAVSLALSAALAILLTNLILFRPVITGYWRSGNRSEQEVGPLVDYEIAQGGTSSAILPVNYNVRFTLRSRSLLGLAALAWLKRADAAIQISLAPRGVLLISEEGDSSMAADVTNLRAIFPISDQVNPSGVVAYSLLGFTQAQAHPGLEINVDCGLTVGHKKHSLLKALVRLDPGVKTVRLVGAV